ncbi:unnamed protein product [Polarella glacialis]|uniref:Methyltransferase FkbM domain-containing protein n=1 Tax=Polarella glacialis TaxID=89957 RepID=A0A813EPG1_POLGL|nr:unnamed protein product [Polarella glacialis]
MRALAVFGAAHVALYLTSCRAQHLTDLSCQTPGSSGINWPELRSNLSFYMGMNLASDDITLDPQSPVFRDAWDLWYKLESDASLAVKAESECMAGFVTLKMLAFMALSEMEMFEEMVKAEGWSIHEVFRFLAETMDWHLIVASGWPLFGMLAKCEKAAIERLAIHSPLNAYFESIWLSEVPFLQNIEGYLRSWLSVPIADSALVLSYPETSPFARAIGMLALADTARIPRVPLGRDSGQTIRLVRRAAYLLNAELLTKQFPPIIVLSLRWPKFQLLDRLSCSPEVVLRLPAAASVRQPKLAVLPLREKVSDVVRACQMPYCDLDFQELALRAAASASSPTAAGRLRIVEVGANLGDCTVWAAAHFGRRLVRATAVEPVPVIADALRRSVELNGWRDRIEVVEALAGNRSGQGTLHLLGQAAGNPFAGASGSSFSGIESTKLGVKLTTLTELMQNYPRVAVMGRKLPFRTMTLLKIWAYGDLLHVLRGAPPGLGRRVDAVWLAFAIDHFTSPTRAAMHLTDFFWRWRFVLALPGMDSNWCRSPRRDHRFQFSSRVRSFIRENYRKGKVMTVVAFKRGSLRCPPLTSSLLLQTGQDASSGPQRQQDQVEASPRPIGCFFGRSARQSALQEQGADYESYFLGPEFPRL